MNGAKRSSLDFESEANQPKGFAYLHLRSKELIGFERYGPAKSIYLVFKLNPVLHHLQFL